MKSNPKADDFRSGLRRLLIVPVAALLLLAGILSIGILGLVRSARWVDHTDQVIAVASTLQTLMIDEETGVRGFLLSQDPVTLEPWNKATDRIGSQFDELAQLVIDNPVQEERLSAIRTNHDAWRRSAEQRIVQIAPLSNPSTVVLQDKNRMDELRREMAGFLQTEEQLRQIRSRQTTVALHWLLLTLGVASMIFGIAVALWLFHRINALNQRHQEQIESVYRERQWLQTTLRSIGDAVVATDAEGCVIFMNSLAEACTGWTEPEARNRPLSEIFHIVNEATRAAVESPVSKVRRTGMVCGLANHTVLIRKDGSEVSIDDSGAPIRDSEGEIIGIVLVFRDVEEKRTAEKALEASEGRFRTLVEVAPVGVAMADATSGRLLFANEEMARIVGYSTEELVSMSSNDLTHPDDLDANRKLYRRVQEGASEEEVVTKRYIRKDGRAVWVRVRVRVVHDPSHQSPRILGTVEDITESRRAQQALEESESRLTLFVDSIPTLAWMANPDGWIFWYNRRWYEYTGATAKEMEGWGWQSVHDPEMLPSVLERWSTCIRTGAPFEMVLPLRGSDGVFRSFMTRVIPVKDSAGEITRWFGTNTEVDELQRTREQLMIAEERIRVALKNVPLILYTADRDLRYTWMHRAPDSFDIKEIIGRRDDEIEASETTNLLMDFKQSVMERDQADRRELRLTIKGVSEVYDITAEPLHDANGAVKGVTVAALNITERALAEQELREKAELIDLAQSAVNAGYWSYFPATGECVLSSGEQILLGLHGSARPNLAEIVERIHAADQEHVIQAFQKAMESGTYFAEFRIQKEDGTIRWLAGQGRVLHKGDEKYMVGINFDVTNQKLSEEALRKSEKLAVAGRLAATIAHEINNPLEAVTNLLYLVRTNTRDEPVRNYVVSAEEELARVTQIVTHSLRFHRQSTAPTYEIISKILESSAGIYKSRLLLDQVEIERDYRDHTPIRCYSSELRQVFGNLISNAFDAIRRGGKIYLRTREVVDLGSGQRGIRVSIADSGHGMDARTLQRLFEPFFTTKESNGTGLGLWISNDIIKKHHGKVLVKSWQRPDRSGTVFSVFLPLNAIDEDVTIGVSEISR